LTDTRDAQEKRDMQVRQTRIKGGEIPLKRGKEKKEKENRRWEVIISQDESLAALGKLTNHGVCGNQRHI